MKRKALKQTVLIWLVKEMQKEETNSKSEPELSGSGRNYMEKRYSFHHQEMLIKTSLTSMTINIHCLSPLMFLHLYISWRTQVIPTSLIQARITKEEIRQILASPFLYWFKERMHTWQQRQNYTNIDDNRKAD